MTFRTFPICFRLILKKISFDSQNPQNMKAGKLGISFSCVHICTLTFLINHKHDIKKSTINHAPQVAFC